MHMQNAFLSKNVQLQNDRMRTSWPGFVFGLWRSARLGLMGLVIELLAGIIVVLFTKNAGLAGLALVYASHMTSALCSTLERAAVVLGSVAT